jgi:hypothetical protein
MKLLSTPKSNPKINKNIKQGVLTAPLHLAPFNLSGYQVCPMASKGCAAACLNTAGRGGMFKHGETTNVIQEARKRKTKLFFEQRDAFMQILCDDIAALVRKADKQSLSCAIRLNATSDIPWENIPVKWYFDVPNNLSETTRNIMEMFPSVQFYDYTKRYNRKNLPNNYHLTFSLAEDNDDKAVEAYNNGMNVAVVFRKQLPDVFKLGDNLIPVINGDEHDYRPADPKGCIVGLKAKGKARHDTSGFTREANQGAYCTA